jgi:hypothetical protein
VRVRNIRQHEREAEERGLGAENVEVNTNGEVRERCSISLRTGRPRPRNMYNIQTGHKAARFRERD